MGAGASRWRCRMNANETLEIARLACLSYVDYARERKAAAQAMGIPVTALDKQVKAARASLGTGPTASKPFVLSEIVPWEETVDGVELVGDTIAAFDRHVIIGDQEKLTAVFWVAHCYVIPAASITPRLAVTSEFPESGKTTDRKSVV